MYIGSFKEFAELLSVDQSFADNNVFSALDYRRMGALRLTVIFTATVLGGYFNSDDLFEEFLDRYNDEFPSEPDIQANFQKVLQFIAECGFKDKSRIRRKTDLFTALIEICELLCKVKLPLRPSNFIDALNKFYMHVDKGQLDQNRPSGIYYKSALQASSDRVNRVRRGIIFNGVILGSHEDVIMERLRQQGLN